MNADDMDFYYAIMSNIYTFILNGVTSYCLYYMVRGFMKERKYAGFSGLAYFFVITLLYYIPVYFSHSAAYGLAVSAAVIVMCLAESERRRQMIFLGITFFSLRWMTLALGNCTSSLMELYFPCIWQPLDSMRKILWRSVLYDIIELGRAFFLLFSAVWIIHKFYIYKYAEMTKKELLMLSTPSLSGMAGYQMLKLYQIMYTNDTGKSLFDTYKSYYWLSFLYYAVSFASVLVMIVLFQNIKKGQEEKWQNGILLGQMEDMKKHIDMLEQRYRDIRGMKHDMGNHVMTLERLYIRQEFGEAKRYTEQLMKELQGGESEIRSGNPVTDVILMEKQDEAEKKGISFVCDFHYPEGMDMNAFDISIILNNALANAIEHAAICEHPYVHAVSYRNKNVYMMDFYNNFQGELFINKESGLPMTTKPPGTGHGFGLSNIRKVAQKYSGEISAEAEGEVFKLSVMMLAAGNGGYL